MEFGSAQGTQTGDQVRPAPFYHDLNAEHRTSYSLTSTLDIRRLTKSLSHSALFSFFLLSHSASIGSAVLSVINARNLVVDTAALIRVLNMPAHLH